ncbi:hypothetical protein PSN45_002830 [Yamadazyma tenuis]|nr:hypothetical protein PSN45_002830 [Yamadazyma tenuis]
MTSREWVLPPRPKPGRKPSVDTPASKRKAQNRAAQRAFRERRATRVQELESKLLEVEKERDVKEMGLINTINKMKLENQYLIKSLEQLKAEVHSIKRPSGSGPTPSSAGSSTGIYGATGMVHSGVSAKSPTNLASNSPTASIYSVQQISPAPSASADSPPVLGINFKRYSKASVSIGRTPKIEEHNNEFDCGVCMKDDCICESIGIKEKTHPHSHNHNLEETLSKFKPMQAVSLKRKSTTQEIDFTRKFNKRALPDFKKTVSEQSVSADSKFDESSPVDNCGFCSDDTPCVCREAAKEAARLNESLNHTSNDHDDSDLHNDDDSDDFDDQTLPPIQMSSSIRKISLPVMHPGPSVGIRDITNLTPGAVPTVMTPTIGTPTSSNPTGIPSNAGNNSNSESGCTGNPGACSQCQTDPMSTLFCTTVANKGKESNERGGSRSGSSSSDSVPNSSAYSGTSLSAGSTSNAASPRDLPPLSSSATSMNPSTPLDTTNPSTPTSTMMHMANNGTMFIPCADAYKTLSRHKKFNSVDFSTLVGKLTTRGMQVEVQSVANVLRELDRRVYN